MRAEDFRVVLQQSTKEGRYQLLEPEGFDLLRLLSIPCPRFEVVSAPEEIGEGLLSAFPGRRVVVKGISPDVLHKSETGVVRIVSKSREQVVTAGREIAQGMNGLDFRGLMIQELVEYEPSPGAEVLVSLRWDREFGAVVSVGFGGVHAEKMTAALREERALAMLSPALEEAVSLERMLSGALITDLLTRAQRGRPARLAERQLEQLVGRLVMGARLGLAELVDDLEINPLVARDGCLVAVDVLVRRAAERPSPAAPRPLAKLDRLLRPASVAIIGVAERFNPGRLILRNLLQQGFATDSVAVVKPGWDSIEGCCCYEDIASLPEAVDLLIVSVGAERVPEILRATIDHRKAESILLIPGGFEGTPGGTQLGEEVRLCLAAARGSDWRGPIVNGGNCLGIRSQPGRYDTFFLPQYKLPVIEGAPGKVAIIAQSGAFLASKTSKLPALPVRYAISIGNQIDLTVGDYLTHLASDDKVELFAIYVEGFRDLDGRRFLEAACSITASGREVVLYRAGRGRSGIEAAASHTAAMAGSYRITKALARSAGVLVAETLEDFEDLLLLLSLLSDRSARGKRVGAVSNAGYECVAIWDGLGDLQPAVFSPKTRSALSELFRSNRIEGIAEVRNPLDLTPILGDAEYEAAVRFVLEDPGVDIAVIGCVPFTGALNTLPTSTGHREAVGNPSSIAARLVRIWHQTRKPWVAVVDAGSDYDAMVSVLLEGGVPVFRAADRAIRLLNLCYGPHRRQGVPQPVGDCELV